MDRSQLNEVYRELDGKARQIGAVVSGSFGYYNGHYHKDSSGNYEMDHFPIPVITVPGVCDIEVDLDEISVTTKLTKENALLFDFRRLAAYDFEAYGVENYLEDFYGAGDTVGTMLEKIRASDEDAIFFSFCFSCEVAAETIGKLAEFIQREGFFY